MEEMIKTIIEQGVLIVILLVFLNQYKEDREDTKKEREESKIITKEVIEVVKDNKIIVQDSIDTKNKMIDSLAYSKDSHDKIESDLEDIKGDLNYLKSRTCDDDIMPILERVEGKVDRLGKSEENNK